MGLTKTAITRPVFILMLMVAMVLLGYISYSSMRKEQNPEVSFGVVTVVTPYPGASPDEVNTLVSRKVEQAVSGINGLREVTANSQEGTSVVVASFNIGTNMDSALSDVRSKVDAIANDLPTDTLKPTINKIDTSSSPVLTMVVSSPTLNNKDLRDLVDDKIADQFGQIDGVAQVNVNGGQVRELQVRLHKDALLKYHLGIVNIQQAVFAATQNVPAGHYITGNQQANIRVLGEFKTVDDLRNMIIAIPDPTQFVSLPRTVHLKDVADVEDSTAERDSYNRLNGQEAVSIVVQKAREGNSIDISKAADAVIQQVKAEYGVTIIKTYDESTTIKESLSDLNFSLFFGVFLVASIVFLFLHNFRGMLIVAIAIPVCLMTSFIAMSLLGFTINNMSMLALSLAIGVLVDDAIVVLENIYRHLRMGEDPREAAINGRSEIGLAAIAITMADVVVFTPIGFMGGVVGEFFKPLALSFAATVLVSLFVSFTVTPMLAARWYRTGEDLEHPTGWFARGFERAFTGLQRFYRHTLDWALNHRWFIFITGFTVLFCVFSMIGGSTVAPHAPAHATGSDANPAKYGIAAAFGAGLGMTKFAFFIGVIVFVINLFRPVVKPRLLLSALAFGLLFPIASVIGYTWQQWKTPGEAGPLLTFQFIPNTDQGNVNISIELPPDASLAATEAVVKQIEGIVMKDPDTKYVLSQVGASGSGGFNTSSIGSNRASIQVTLYDRESFTDHFRSLKPGEHLRTRLDTAVAADFTERIGKVPGASVKVSATGSGFGSPIQMSFQGDDRQLLVGTVSNIVDKLRQGAIPGIINPDLSSRPGVPESDIVPDRLRLAQYGLSVAQLGQAIRVMYQGDNSAKFRVNGREYDIRVMLDYADRNNPNIIRDLPVSFSFGTPLFLSDLGTVTAGTGVDVINRRNRTEEVQLTADLLPGYAAGTVQSAINAYLDKNHLVPAGVKVKPLGQADFQARESGNLFVAMGIGLLLVYMLLASLYDNILYPFIIQLAQPQAIVGALLALMITNMDLNIVGMVGIIVLIGLVGKNAILVVDYTNTLRGRGRNRHDALLEAGPTRLRPIMMTTLALIFGIMPVALAIGRGSEFRQTIGIAIIGGIALSTLLTLLVIPCSYTIFDDFSVWVGRLIHRRPAAPEGPSEPPILEREPEPAAVR